MRPHGKYARVDAANPEAFAQCDRCGFWRNRGDLVWQIQWGGVNLYNQQLLVCKDRCYDTPNEQLRTIILPPDPPPIINARPPNFTYEENGPVQTTLTATVAQGVTVLPVNSATGFVVGNNVWIQLDNATYGRETLAGVDTVGNTLTLSAPLPFSAPITGSVTVASI